MRKPFAGLAAALVAGACVAASSAGAADAWTGNVDAFVGGKVLGGDWELPLLDLRYQSEVGLAGDVCPPGWPVSLSVGLFYSWDDHSTTASVPFLSYSADLDGEVTTWEVDLGAKKYVQLTHWFAPFVAAGLALAHVDLEVSGNAHNVEGYPEGAVNVDESDTVFGGWLAGGIQFTIARHVNLGAEVKYNRMSDAQFSGDDVSMSSWRYAFFAGYHF